MKASTIGWLNKLSMFLVNYKNAIVSCYHDKLFIINKIIEMKIKAC